MNSSITVLGIDGLFPTHSQGLLLYFTNFIFIAFSLLALGGVLYLVYLYPPFIVFLLIDICSIRSFGYFQSTFYMSFLAAFVCKDLLAGFFYFVWRIILFGGILVLSMYSLDVFTWLIVYI